MASSKTLVCDINSSDACNSSVDFQPSLEQGDQYADGDFFNRYLGAKLEKTTLAMDPIDTLNFCTVLFIGFDTN